jgi:hypothetical protein
LKPTCQVFPKSIEIFVPLLCIGLVAPAWLNEEATHRVVGFAACVTLDEFASVFQSIRRQPATQPARRPTEQPSTTKTAHWKKVYIVICGGAALTMLVSWLWRV